ncbi:hypothetical protein J6590_031345 [Homalodisca vitripennis]|nr:hypothetical protein J6590_031345 [Homalodisca vitripennis]
MEPPKPIGTDPRNKLHKAVGIEVSVKARGSPNNAERPWSPTRSIINQLASLGGLEAINRTNSGGVGGLAGKHREPRRCSFTICKSKSGMMSQKPTHLASASASSVRAEDDAF